MSELQISLISIGLVVILMICIYNWWQQRQYRRKFRDAFQHQHEDALYHQSSDESALNPDKHFIPSTEETPIASSIEPAAINQAIELTSAGQPKELPENTEKEEELVSADLMSDEKSSAKPAEQSLCASLGEKTDYIATMSFKDPQGAGALTSLWQQRFDFGKNIHVCGWNAASGEWEKVIAESKPLYRSLRLALQLVSRSGAVSEPKLKDFRELIRTIATKQHADVILPDVSEAAARAHELDNFCATVDQIIAFNIVPEEAQLFNGDGVARAAERLGMQFLADGAFHMTDTHGRTLFSLCNEDNTPFQYHTLSQLQIRGLTLLLDVPCVEKPTLVFDDMVILARKLAIEMGGNIVDANHVPLKERSIMLIRDRIVTVETNMQDSGMIPGSALTRRLFS